MDYEFWVYIVASQSGTLYVGMTNDLKVRVGQHKSGEIDGFAKKYHCTRLVYFEKFDNIFKTIAREKQLKGWRRSKKVALIEKINPRWQDLAEKWGAQMLFPGEKMASK
jgi:putative endonuclease